MRYNKGWSNIYPEAHKLTQEERKRGGINSGIARRKKREQRERLEIMMDIIAKELERDFEWDFEWDFEDLEWNFEDDESKKEGGDH